MSTKLIINSKVQIKLARRITGMSAILLPFEESGSVDWSGFEHHLTKTLEAGLIPAVNMDTGFANLITEDVRNEVLRRTQAISGSRPFVAGAFVKDQPGEPLALASYFKQFDAIQSHGGTPIVFQSFGLTSLAEKELIEAYESLGRKADRFLAFELGNMFAPFGKIYSLDAYEALLSVKSCVGAKHSSLDREQEWDRLLIRDRVRPDFMVLTGNDLAIDMVMYGSDYLLGLSTFAPDLFALRDRWWLEQDSRFYSLNDVLQYLGFFAFRAPVPAYKHSAAQFLKIRGWLGSNRTHPASPARKEYDQEVLELIWGQLRDFLRWL